ncbi:MAG: phospholipase A [Burkholderiales bacterium]|nr:phospholipase A [Burkholderiales bacterium]
MILRRILLLAALLQPSLLLAAETVVVAPSGQVRAGERFAVAVYFNNVSDAAETVPIPRALRARLRGAGLSAEVMLTLVADGAPPTDTLLPGAFRKTAYAGTVPAGASGTVTLELIEVAANSAMFAVLAPAAVAAAPEPAASAPAADPPTAPDSVGDDFNPTAVLARFDVYEPMYFAVGARTNTNAKFQLSFRYRMLWDLNLAYTQTSLWDLRSASKPFYDSAYKPRLFWYRDDLGYRGGGLSRLGLEVGVGHESNGKDGMDSRSINIAYLTPRLTFGDPDGYHLLVAPRVLGYLEKTDNPDIDDYRGYVDLTMKFGKRDGLLLGAELRRGSQGYSAQLDLSYPLRPLSGDRFGGYLQLQYFNGYGESLLDYNRKLPSQVRLGYMLVR